jgi:hypothetical protein
MGSPVAAQTQQAQNGISRHVQAAQPDRDEFRGPKFLTLVEEEVSLNFASWNPLDAWLRQIEGLRRAA